MEHRGPCHTTKPMLKSPCTATAEPHVPGARALQQEKPPWWEALAPQPESGPCCPQLEKAHAQQWSPAQPNIKIKFKKKSLNSSFTPHQVGILHLLWNQYLPLTSLWFKQPLRLNAAMLMLNKQHCVKLAYLWMFIPLLLPQMSAPHGQESCLFNSISLEPYIHIRYVIKRFFFLPSRTACGILVHWPGIEPVSSAVESGNMWTAKEVQNFGRMNKWGVSLIVLWIISEELGFHLIFISNLANIDWTYGYQTLYQAQKWMRYGT